MSRVFWDTNLFVYLIEGKLLVSQHLHRIRVCTTSCRDVARHPGDTQHHDDRDAQRTAVEWIETVQKAIEKAGQPDPARDTESNADSDRDQTPPHDENEQAGALAAKRTPHTELPHLPSYRVAD